MSMPEPSFWKYLIFSDEGYITGIDPNAPQSEKQAFEAWNTEQSQMKRGGIKI